MTDKKPKKEAYAKAERFFTDDSGRIKVIVTRIIFDDRILYSDETIPCNCPNKVVNISPKIPEYIIATAKHKNAIIPSKI
jgi:hypothetical protein